MFQYRRQLTLASAHFNGQRAYDEARALFGPERPHPPSDAASVAEIYSAMAKRICDATHGHNFLVTIEIDAEALTPEGFAVSDLDICRIVNAWQNVNLSTHPDFFAWRLRATTEQMAEVLWWKLDRDLKLPYGALMIVEIAETPEQVARFTRHSGGPDNRGLPPWATAVGNPRVVTIPAPGEPVVVSPGPTPGATAGPP